MLNWIQINKMFFCVCCFVHTTFKNVTLACFPFTPFTSSSPHPDLQLSSPSHHHHQCLGFIRGVSNTAQSFTFPRKISESEYFINITDVTSQFNLRCIKYLSIPKKKWNESRVWAWSGLFGSLLADMWLWCGLLAAPIWQTATDHYECNVYGVGQIWATSILLALCGFLTCLLLMFEWNEF